MNKKIDFFTNTSYGIFADDKIYQNCRILQYEDSNYLISNNMILTINCTAMCNAKCFFCYNLDTNIVGDKYVVSSKEEFQKIVLFSIRAGIKIVTFTGGEPTINPDNLLKMITKCKEVGFTTLRLHTNGLNMRREVIYNGRQMDLWKHIYNEGINEVSLSLSSFNKEINKKIMSVDNSQLIYDLIEEIPEGTFKLRLSCFCCQQGVYTPEDMKEYVDLGNRLGIYYFIFRLAPIKDDFVNEYILNSLTSFLKTGYKLAYCHQKSDAYLAVIRKGKNEIIFSCSKEEIDEDAKIRRLLYMPNGITYTNWLDSSSHLFDDECENAINDLMKIVTNQSKVKEVKRVSYSIDLHIHSRVSDGLLTPCEVIQQAAKSNMKKIVFTEHNCMHDNYTLLQQYAVDFGIEIPFCGIEVNTVYTNKLIPFLKFHLLLYAMEPCQLSFLKEWTQPNYIRNNHIKMLYNRLSKDGLVTKSFKEIFSITDSKAPTKKKMYNRFDLAYEIMQTVGCTMSEAKEKYLPTISEAERYKYWLDTAFIIREAQKNGCVAILAHPCWIRPFNMEDQFDIKDILKAVIDLRICGLDGIEINHRLHDDEMKMQLYSVANNTGMLISGGSDYHGKPRCSFGLQGMTEEEYINLSTLIRRRYKNAFGSHTRNTLKVYI